MRRKLMICSLICFFLPSICFAVIPMPARIGGTVTIDGNALTHSGAANYTFKVTRSDGTALTPPAQSAGLNSNDWYIVDIPIYDSNDQTGGAHVGDAVKIHIFNNGTELSVTSPVSGQFACGDSGSATQINLIATSQIQPQSIPTFSEWGMILFGLLLFGSVAWQIRRNRASV